MKLKLKIIDLGAGKTIEQFIDDTYIILEIEKRYGKRHGKETLYYKSGQIKIEINWANGKRHGEEIKYYENGQIEREGNWVKGKKHGEEVHFYENGQMKYKAIWVNGECIEQQDYKQNI